MKYFTYALTIALGFSALTPSAALAVSPGDVCRNFPCNQSAADKLKNNPRWMEKLSLKRMLPNALSKSNESVGLIGTVKINGADSQISNGWRAEFTDQYTAKINQSIAYNFNTRIPESLPNWDKNIVLAQWHDQAVPGVPAKRPPLSMRIRNGTIIFYLWNDAIWEENGQNGQGKVLASFTPKKGEWFNIKVFASWRTDSRGQILIFLNNKELVNYNGSVGYRSDEAGPYFKFGIYTTNAFSGTMSVSHYGFSKVLL